MHHLRHDRPSISPPYAHKCSHGHMYLVLETFRRTKSATRLSGGWSRLVRQVSDAPPRARSTVQFLSICKGWCPRTDLPRARNLPPRGFFHSAKLQVEATCTTSDCYVGDITRKPRFEEIKTPRGFVALIRRLILQSPSSIQKPSMQSGLIE